MAPDNFLDNLFVDSNENTNNILSNEIIIPNRCALCKTAVVCSILPTFLSLSKIGVCISIDQCPYSVPLKNAEIRKITR
jgi:hypothetical protein